MNLQDFCLPARIYFYAAIIFALIGFYFGYRLRSVFISILFAGFWTWVLNKICDWGYPLIAWIILLFPFIIFLIVLLVIYFTTKKKDKKKLRV